MQVGLDAVAGSDGRDCLVVPVEDQVGAVAIAERDDPALPEGQIPLPCVCLHVHVVGDEPAGELVEPDQAALRAIDQRPVAARTGPIAREDVAGRRIAVACRDAEDRRLHARQGDEGLVVARRWRRVREGTDARGRPWRIDAEAECHVLAANLRRDVHALARGERLARHEACAVALRVGTQRAGMAAALAADRADALDRAARHAEKADLGVRVGRARARARRDEHVRARELRARVHGARKAAWRGCGGACERARDEQANASEDGRRRPGEKARAHGSHALFGPGAPVPLRPSSASQRVRGMLPSVEAR